MKLFLLPHHPLTAMSKRLKKEYPEIVVRNCDLYDLRNNLIAIYNTKTLKELDEINFYANQEIQRKELYNFDTFFALRLAYYGLGFAFFTLVMEKLDIELIFQLDIEFFCILGVVFLIIILTVYNLISNYQKEKLLYNRFKQECLDNVINSKNLNKKIKYK